MSAQKEFRITGAHVLAAVVGFFVVVIAIDVTFATIAYRTFSGEVAENPYEAGLLFNETLERRREAAALGWSAGVEADGGVLSVRLSDRDGAPLDGLSVEATLTRPATSAGQQSLTLTPRGGGHYAATLPNAAGAWDVRATAKGPRGEVFEVEHRIRLP